MPQTAAYLRRQRRWVLIALVVLIGAVFAQSWGGRVVLNQKLRQGCERSILDRLVSRDQAISAYRANWLVGTDVEQPQRTRKARLAQARENLHAARSYELRIPVAQHRSDMPGGVVRTGLDCARVYPRPSPLR